MLAARRSTLGSPKALLIPVLPVFGLMCALIMVYNLIKTVKCGEPNVR